jgi:hypothetical protein
VLSFNANRNQLFAAWPALVAVRAESQDGLEKGKLENGVLEPLREADLIE